MLHVLQPIPGADNPPGSLCREVRNVELEPLTLLSALAASTNHIGLAATASTSYNEPYHIALKFASIDHVSRGRAAWNVVTSYSKSEALNFNRDEHFTSDERYARAAERHATAVLSALSRTYRTRGLAPSPPALR